MDQIPWKDAATLIRRSDSADSGDTDIVMEGTLRDAVKAASKTPQGLRRYLRVALPDRHVRPFSFEGPGLDMLINRERALWLTGEG